MKKLQYIVLFWTLIAGCNSNSATTARESNTAEKEMPANDPQLKPGETGLDITSEVNADTLGLAKFLALKAARFPDANRVYTNISTGKKEINVDTSGWATYKRINVKADRQPNKVATPRQETALKSKKRDSSQDSKPVKNETVAQRKVPEVDDTSADQSKTGEVLADQTKEKKEVNKGLSNKTKGTIIGAVTGAAAGAAINKRNRKAGGVVGGILGAAAGYGIGRHKDKKDTAAKGVEQVPDNKRPY